MLDDSAEVIEKMRVIENNNLNLCAVGSRDENESVARVQMSMMESES